jgi:hypothetical protein
MAPALPGVIVLRSRRVVVALPLAAVLAFGTVAGLAGCSFQGVVREVTHGHVDVTRKAVPSDFPRAVPLADGEVLYGASVGSSDGKLWNVTIKVHGADPMTAIDAQLADAGFAKDADSATSKAGTASYTKKPYSVLVVVAKDGERGRVANYTVTEKM